MFCAWLSYKKQVGFYANLMIGEADCLAPTPKSLSVIE
jgi:hypothetical protein